MNPADCEQNTPEWRQFRTGKVTASRIKDVLRKPKRGQKESTTRKAYLGQIVAERLTGKPIEQDFESWDMRRGTTLEPRARAEYELTCSQDVRPVGFIDHPAIKYAGCSPDALVGPDGLAQFKCPRTHVHLDYIRAGVVPAEYRGQMLFEMSCTQRKWNDFVSYCDEMPAHLQLFVVRLERNDAEIAEIEAEVVKFVAEVDDIIAELPGPDGKSALTRQLEASVAGLNASGRAAVKRGDSLNAPAKEVTDEEFEMEIRP